MAGWIDSVKLVALADVFEHLGIGQVRGRTCAPCPQCNAETRSGSDKRGPMNVHHRDGRDLWHCKACESGGDGIAAVSYALAGSLFSDCHDEDKNRIRAWFADRGWCEPRQGHRVPVVRPRPPKVRRLGVEHIRANLDPPPADEVRALWAQCQHPLYGNAGGQVMFYLQDRGYNATQIAAMKVCRAVPLELQDRPRWWPASWLLPRTPEPPWFRWSDGVKTETDEPPATNFRLIFPAFTAAGRFASLHARRVPWYDGARACCEACGSRLPKVPKLIERCECGWRPRRKTTWPAGFNAEGLLFADRGGAELLRGKPRHTTVLVVEGVTDLLRASLLADQAGVAVLGFASGGTKALGDIRWPEGVTVGIATDEDKAGEQYAEAAAQALPMRALRIRWSALEGH